ncbi:hypothetical protein BJX64DRAFT_207545 [Aspergillus heterothallicus]
MSPGNSNTRGPESPRKRTRTGCLPCRNRRRKCDGARPRCHNCQTKGCTCQWGVKASFHASRSQSLSAKDSVALAAIEQQRKRRSRRGQRPVTIIDETEEIMSSYTILDDVDATPDIEDFGLSDHGGAEDYSVVDATIHGTMPPNTQPSPDYLRASLLMGGTDGSIYDPSRQNPVIEAPPQLVPPGFSIGDLLFRRTRPSDEQIDSSYPLPRNQSPLSEPIYTDTFIRSTGDDARDSSSPLTPNHSFAEEALKPLELALPISAAEKAQLIRAYMQETGTWCETTDSEMQFTVGNVHDIIYSPAATAAVMALASRQLDNVRRWQRPVTLELYQYTVQLLLRQEPLKQDASVLAACTLLCVYEMMASGVHEWRRHLKAQKWNGSSTGIVKSCFWAFARIDTWAAFVSRKTTLIPTNFWMDDILIPSVASSGNVDDYCNLANLIFAELVNLLNSYPLQEDRHGGTKAASILLLWEKLREWRRLRLREVQPLLRNSSALSGVYPEVLYSRSSSICGNTFYHAGSLLILQTSIYLPGAEDSLHEIHNATWHARELCGISMSNPSHANWVNQLQPLYIAGTAFAIRSEPLRGRGYTETRRRTVADQPLPETMVEEYATEKVLLLKHLATIERETGWKTSDRAADLRVLWGMA